MKCRECKWWCGANRSNDFPSMGDCRVGAPRVVQMGDTSVGLEYDTVWPRTDASDWCAKWEKSERTPEMMHITEPVATVIDQCAAAHSSLFSSPSGVETE